MSTIETVVDTIFDLEKTLKGLYELRDTLQSENMAEENIDLMARCDNFLELLEIRAIYEKSIRSVGDGSVMEVDYTFRDADLLDTILKLKAAFPQYRKVDEREDAIVFVFDTGIGTGAIRVVSPIRSGPPAAWRDDTCTLSLLR